MIYIYIISCIIDLITPLILGFYYAASTLLCKRGLGLGVVVVSPLMALLIQFRAIRV